MSAITKPTNKSFYLGDQNRKLSPWWAEWFMSVYRICFAQCQSGTTAERPTKGLYIGRRYFDTTLGMPIWYDGSDWIDATGASA